MADSIRGMWARNNVGPVFSGATKWGTGIDPIHSYYGDPTEQNIGVYGRQGLAVRPDVQDPAYASEQFVEQRPPWGYDPGDIAGLDVYASPHEAVNGVPFIQDGWPNLDDSTPQTRANLQRYADYPVGSPGIVASALRALRIGPKDLDSEKSNQIPTETVSEGWENKPQGELADAEPASDAQVFTQTSMTQRYRTRTNDAAVARLTDGPRSPISSRTTGQKLKYFSGGERHYDMAPFQQDQMNRPFWYRTFGTGPQTPDYLDANEMNPVSPLQRTPPADPYLGPTDDSLAFGYTSEDQLYA